MVLCGRIRESERLFERSDIEVEGRDGVPVHHVRVGSEEVLHSRKGLAQLVEKLAQVIARLSLGGVGPEEEGKMLALLRNVVMQHEVGEQGLQAHGVETSHLPIIVDEAEIAEQAEVKGWHRHDRLAFSSSGSGDGRVVSSGNFVEMSSFIAKLTKSCSVDNTLIFTLHLFFFCAHSCSI